MTGIYERGNAYDRRYIQKQTYVPHGHTNKTDTDTVYVLEKSVLPPSFDSSLMGCPHRQQKVDVWAFLLGTVLGAGKAWAGNKVQNTNVQQTNPNVNYLQNLQHMYPNHKIADNGDGTFSATDANGKKYGPADYMKMQDLLSNNAPTEEKKPVEEEKKPVEEEKKPVEEEKKPVEEEKKPVKEEKKPTGRPIDDGRGAKVNGVNGSQPKGNEWTAERKAQPQTVKISFSIHTNGLNNGYARVTMPDGKTYTVTTGASLSHNRAMSALAESMREKLSDAGWTNVTFVNDNFNFKQAPAADRASSASAANKSEQAGGPREYSAAEKAKPRTLQISFSIHTMRGNNGTATVKTPDGKTYTVRTGMSLTHQRAMEDLSKQMKSTLSQAGWTNVTLENKNFNWSD